MPFCTYCGQSFTRDEHLERHILTHTNVKPYKCFTCHMSFARRDLLHRHYTVHGKDANNEPLPASNGIVPKSAGRTPIACSNCAKTKTKCDKKFPCTRCATRNLTCTVRPTRRMTKNLPRLPSDDSKSSEIEAPALSADSSSASSNGSPVLEDGKPLLQINTHEHTSPAGSKLNEGGAGPTPVSSASHTPDSTHVHNTPVSGYSDFHNSCDSSLSPTFNMDWSQMQMPFGAFEHPRQDILMGSDFLFSPGLMDHNFMEPTGFMPLPTPQMSDNMAPMNMCLPTPVEQGFGPPSHASMTMDHAASYFPVSRASPPSSPTDIDNSTALLDAWPAFRCNPQAQSSKCPKTAKIHLERLEQSLRSHDSWASWRPTWDATDFPVGDMLSVAPMSEMPRDKLLAITQTFLHKALDTHKSDQSMPGVNSHNNGAGFHSNFVILPPARVLEHFLQLYVNGFERYYPLTAKGSLNVNQLMQGQNDKASSLLILLMVAQGALITPSVDARWLTAGLTEACRISLFDLVEKDVNMSGDLTVLQSALIFTVQAAWSGDKWHMDIAMGQRGMYLSMLRHSGLLHPRPPVRAMNQRLNVDSLWEEWVEQESRSRLIYSWAMVDQDLSLFHDTAPLFSVAEFAEPMPDSDALWSAKTSQEWSSIFEQVHEFAGGYSSVGSGARPLSLRDLFKHFLDDAIISQGIELTPLHLRLLLHPLQLLVSQYRQLLSCFSEPVHHARPTLTRQSSFTAASTQSRLDELQAILQRWYNLADRYMKANPMCPLMQVALVMFHLVSLNAVASFPDVERLARRDDVDASYQSLVWAHKRALSDPEQAVFHAGQVLRHVRAMPRSIRPPWWAAAVYRAGLVLWADGLTKEPHAHAHQHSHNHNQHTLFPGMDASTFAVDALPPDHPIIVRYLTQREGTPALTKRDGAFLPLSNPFGVLFHCVDVVAEGVATRFTDGIRSKLERLAKGAAAA